MSSAPSWPVPPDAQSLRDRWQRRLRLAGVAPAPVVATWDDLVAAYGSPARGYHTLEHVGEVLAWVDRIDPAPSLPLELATWLHDVVYTAGAPDNERASASWARDRFTGHLDDIALERACELVVMTMTHDPPPEDHDATVLADADLAILGAPPERYRRYATDVRAEYAGLDADAWAAGRRRVLESMLARGRLYHHATTGALEEQARRNLASELAELDLPGSGAAQPGST